MGLDALSEALKNANRGGEGKLDESAMNLPQGEESMVGTSPDRKVKKRKNSEHRKRVKKKKLKDLVRSLHAIREENEQIMSQNDFMTQKLVEIQKQRAEVRVAQNKIFTALENSAETLWQQLMVGSNQLEVVAQFVEPEYRHMVLDMKIELLCKVIVDDKPYSINHEKEIR